MTEEDAKTKWCPHVAIVLATAGIGAATAGDNDSLARITNDSQMCQASDCMMWQEDKYFQTEDGRMFNCEVVDGGEWKTEGHCGLTK